MNAHRSVLIRQHALETLCAATLRASTHDRQLRYRTGHLERGETPLALGAAHLRLAPASDDAINLAAQRGAVDGLALKLADSDAKLHHALCPTTPIERFIFDMLEQFRVESRCPQTLPGVAENIRTRFAAWSAAFMAAPVFETSLGLLLFSITQMCWSRITGLALSDDIADRIEGTRVNVGPLLGSALSGLRQHRDDQRAFAEHALAVTQVVGELVRTERTLLDQFQEAVRDFDPRKEGANFTLVLDGLVEGGEMLRSFMPSANGALLPVARTDYRVFTTRYDRVTQAHQLLRAEQLHQFRTQLDQQISQHAINVPRLARALRDGLLQSTVDGWQFGEDEGELDRKRLTQVVSAPLNGRVFKQPHTRPRCDVAVSMLLDCSGSTKTHALTTAVLADSLGRALDMIGASTEVLGFTTETWNGGEARRAWRAAGAPENPGRLNALQHIVFKASDEHWRRARHQFGALLKADLFREGVDGEAVQWACARLREHDARCKLLLVISDGCPMDTATLQANGADYLVSHLQRVITREESNGVTIMGVGLGLDLSPWYRHSVDIDTDTPLSTAALLRVAHALVAKTRPRRVRG